MSGLTSLPDKNEPCLCNGNSNIWIQKFYEMMPAKNLDVAISEYLLSIMIRTVYDYKNLSH